MSQHRHQHEENDAASPTYDDVQRKRSFREQQEMPLVGNYVRGLLQCHEMSKRVGKQEATGGVMPFCVDPDTNVGYFLLGRTRKGSYCHFHGWIDEGETVMQGSARECWEESKGCFADMVDVYAALCNSAYSIYLTGSMKIVHLGLLTEGRRQDVVDDFRKMPVYFHCMDEVKDVTFVEAVSLRNQCIRYAMEVVKPVQSQLKHDAKNQGKELRFSDLKPTQLKLPLKFGFGDYAVKGFRSDSSLRGFLVDWLASPHDCEAIWLSPQVTALIENRTIEVEHQQQSQQANDATATAQPPSKQVVAYRPIQMLRALPCFGVAERRVLAKALHISVCDVCGREGHALGTCQVLQNLGCYFNPPAAGISDAGDWGASGAFDPSTPDQAQPLRRVGSLGGAISARHPAVLRYMRAGRVVYQQRTARDNKTVYFELKLRDVKERYSSRLMTPIGDTLRVVLASQTNNQQQLQQQQQQGEEASTVLLTTYGSLQSDAAAFATASPQVLQLLERDGSSGGVDVWYSPRMLGLWRTAGTIVQRCK